MDDEIEPPMKKQKLEENYVETDAQKGIQHQADFTEDVDTDTVEDKFTITADKYSNYVDPEELEKLREFQVLDEVRSNDEDSNDEDSDSSDGKSEVPEDEIEKMLEEDLPEDFKGVPKPKEKPYITRQKIVLEEKGVNHFEVLPLDWMMVRHYSGMPIYMHRASRVCTLSKPYFLGKGNTRRHDIPISAIPCLAYRRALEEEQKQKEIDKDIEEQIKNGTWQQNADTNKSITQTNNKKTDTNGDSNGSTVAKCPFLHGERVQSDTQMPNNHDELMTQTISNKEDLEIITTSNAESTECISRNIVDNDSDNCEDLIKSLSKSFDEDINRVNGINNCEDKSKSSEENLNNILSENEVENPISQEIDDLDQLENKIEINDSESTSTNDYSTNDNLKSIDEISQSNDSQISCNDNGITNDIPLKSSVINDDQDETINETSITDGYDKTDENSPNEQNTQDEPNNEAVNNANGVGNEIPLNRQPVVLPGGVVMPPPRVETVSTSWKTQHLTHDQVNDYCKKLFRFKTVNIMHFKRWADRRKYQKARKTLQYPTLPEGTKLITIPAQPANTTDNGGGKASKRDWVMNMNGRSYLSVFHEYVRRALQKQPVYEFKQLENASTPYQATVFIGGMQYGVGHGSSKRSAKSAAARASIHILIPEMRAELDQQPENSNPSDPDFSFFDYVGIEDPRITEFCAATCEPSPHAILRTCLLRNFGAGDKHIHTEMKKLEYQKIELTMKVGKHSATVVCKNKKTAKQRASQAILQALHPHVRSWGSLLRLYGSRSVKSCAEKKLEEQQITLLQDAARHNEPNYAVLDKLRHEMRKLRERDEAVVPIGTLLLNDHLPTHSASNLNNVDL